MEESLAILSSLTRRPLLTAEQELALARQIQAGDTAARNRLIESNVRLVIDIAKRYRVNMPLEELTAEGMLGLITAAEKFDPKQMCKFSTYATWWVRRAILRAQAKYLDGRNATRLPIHTTAQLSKLNKLMTENPSLENDTEGIAVGLGVRLGTARLLLSLRQEEQMPLSLDAPIKGMAEPLGACIAESAPGEPSDVELMIEEALSGLTRREAQVIHLRDFEGKKFPEMASILGINRVRVAEIYHIALAKLRHSVRCKVTRTSRRP